MFDWKSRVKNPVFWVQIVLAIATPIGAYFGLTGSDMTTWPMMWATIVEAVKNPYVVGLVLVSVWNCINNPTTPGFMDGPKKGR